jgi:8-oxo-dGTP pyrophosphatase MutT (NUDIX family)
MQTTSAATDIAPARPSSTVVLLRQGDRLPEIFMVKRHKRSSFGSAYAFPGGVLESSDSNVHQLCSGRSPAEANTLLSVNDMGLDYFSAAVRELFEEAGVLLGDTELSARELAKARLGLNDGSLRWDRFANEHIKCIRCDQMHYFSFWITPMQMTKRYSTRFFIAQLPAGQAAIHDDGELTDSCWMTASDVLQASRDKTMRVHYPTRKTLESIAAFNSVAEVSEWARSREDAGVRLIELDGIPESER